MGILSAAGRSESDSSYATVLKQDCICLGHGPLSLMTVSDLDSLDTTGQLLPAEPQ